MAFDPAKLPKLQNFLNYYRSGLDGNTMTQEMYDAYGGDDILATLKQFDPNASWEYHDNMTGGGEGGPSGVGGYVLNYDQSKLPKTKFGSVFNVKQAGQGNDVYDDKYVYDDENYGKITHYKNVKKPKDPMWTKIAPLVVGMGGPALGAALAGAGIGGAAGLTSAVTGSGMGSMASGALGKGIAGMVRGMPSMASNAASGNWQGAGMSALGSGLGMAGGAMADIGRWLPVANGALGMMRRK